MAIKKINIGGVNHELQTTTANITDLTATATELNYMDGVTSNVQTQLNDITSEYAKKDDFYYVTSPRDCELGTLITTSIDYSKRNGCAWLLEIIADTYGSQQSMYTQVQGYIYSDTIINYGVTNHGLRIGDLYAMNVGGNLCFWFARIEYWQSFGCRCVLSSNRDYNRNYVVSVTDAAKPDGTKVVNLSNHTYNSAFMSDLTWSNIAGKPSAGDSYTPVYFSDGVPVACTRLDLNTTGNAATATTAEVSKSDIGIRTSGNGSAYTATVTGITGLFVGVTFIMIPNTVSTTTTPTLNVNSFGAKQIRRRLSNNTATAVAGSTASWLAANKPVRVTFDGNYWIIDTNQPSATDIYGTIPITSGGTGAITAASARSNLGAMANVAVTSSDAGKFLRVNSSGVWAAERVPSAESTSF